MAKQFTSITLGELLEVVKDAIREYGEETMVCGSADYGDHCHTQQAIDFSGKLEMKKVEDSAYSDSGYRVSEDFEGDDETGTNVLVLE